MTDADDFQMQLAKTSPMRRPFPFYNTVGYVVITRPHILPPFCVELRILSLFANYSHLRFSFNLASPFNLKFRCRLPLHLVGLVTLSQAEGAGKVAAEVLDLLDVANQRLVDGLLVGGTGAVDLLLL